MSSGESKALKTAGTGLDERGAQALLRMWRRLGFGRAAVRSSGLNEDSSDKSFAGVFDSILNVLSDDVLHAIARVRQSFQRGAESAYTDLKEDGGVIVQKMVPAEWAGVLFTRHPREAGLALVEMVPGTGESLVSGSATPRSICLGRISGRVLEETPPPLDLTELHRLGLKAEKLFGKPQDIEWAFANGQFYLLQSRDITRIAATGPLADFETERARLLELFRDAAPGEIVLAQAEISELVPRPTPSTLSLMEALWQPGAAIDLACRSLGLQYEADEESPPYLVCAFGNLYLNRVASRRRSPPVKPWIVARIIRSAKEIERHLIEDFEPKLLREVNILEAVDPERLELPALLELLATVRQRFVTETYAETSVITLVGTVLLNDARRALEERKINPANALGEMPETPMSRAIAELASKPHNERQLSDFLAVFGHRAPLDYELSCPRYAEDIKLAGFTMANMLAVERPAKRAAMPLDAEGRNDTAITQIILRASRFQALKERAKHHCLRELAVIRRLLVALDKRLALEDGIFQLTFEEIAGLADPAFLPKAHELIAGRRAAAALFKRVNHLPSELSLEMLETLPLDSAGSTTAAPGNGLKGTLVAGYGPVEGRARIIATDDGTVMNFDPNTLSDEAIIVTRLVHPQWLTWLARTRGVVCQVGGWLSHTAILAREYNLPMIIGVQGLDCIKDGDPIRLHADGTVELLAEAPGAAEAQPPKKRINA